MKTLLLQQDVSLVKKSGNDLKNNLSDQPYFSKNKKIALVFNGEFYNFDNFKKKLITEKFDFISSGDTEVFLKLYEKEGIDFLKNKDIDSLFAIAICDLSKKKYLLPEIGLAVFLYIIISIQKDLFFLAN